MKEINNCQKKELENLETKFEKALQEDRREIERKMEEMRNQQSSGERREMIIHSTEDVKIRIGGDVEKLHPVIFISNLKKKVRYIGNFETAKETIRNHLKDEASLWFDSKEEELDNWHKFEQKFLNYFWGKIQQIEINKELQNGRYLDRKGISEKNTCTTIIQQCKKLLHYNYSSEQIVEVIARHFEDTLEDHITLQNYKDIDSLCQFLQIREAKMREREIRRSQENYRQRENKDYRDRRQNFRRDYTRREFIPRSENENRDNGRGNYEQRNQQWNKNRYRENQNGRIEITPAHIKKTEVIIKGMNRKIVETDTGVDELSEKHMVIDFKNNTMKITEGKEEEQDILEMDKEHEKRKKDNVDKKQTVEMNLAMKQGQRRKRRKQQKISKNSEAWDSSRKEMRPEEEKEVKPGIPREKR
uniref:Uncharacterized protein LOC114347985 n=1 Tax=Diabrotica virgifera virgifera TaxID=50390 RepID=A0A6P7H791_DIAVI